MAHKHGGLLVSGGICWHLYTNRDSAHHFSAPWDIIGQEKLLVTALLIKYIYIYIQRITMCPHGYHHIGSMATPALGTRDVRFIYIYIYIVNICMLSNTDDLGSDMPLVTLETKWHWWPWKQDDTIDLQNGMALVIVEAGWHWPWKQVDIDLGNRMTFMSLEIGWHKWPWKQDGTNDIRNGMTLILQTRWHWWLWNQDNVDDFENRMTLMTFGNRMTFLT